jgi:methylmalonyl-CoA mutase N-terminal domain/subunit
MSDEPRDRSTGSGIPTEPVYWPENVPDFDPRTELGEPGSFPFVRGVYRDM